jgi:hypothetical protein
MKNNNILVCLLTLIIFFSFSCNDYKEINKKFQEFVTLNEIPQDSTDKEKAWSDHYLVGGYGGNESGESGGQTKMTFYETKDDKIHVAVQNVTGNAFSGYKPWNDDYTLEYSKLKSIKDEKGFGFLGHVDKSEQGTESITYNFKYLFEDSTVYVTFFGGPKNAKWQQWDYFHFEHPEKAKAIIESIQASIK